MRIRTPVNTLYRTAISPLVYFRIHTGVAGPCMYDGKNQSTRVLNRWKIPGQITDVPKANFKLLNSTYFVEDGSSPVNTLYRTAISPLVYFRIHTGVAGPCQQVTGGEIGLQAGDAPFLQKFAFEVVR